MSTAVGAITDYFNYLCFLHPPPPFTLQCPPVLHPQITDNFCRWKAEDGSVQIAPFPPGAGNAKGRHFQPAMAQRNQSLTNEWNRCWGCSMWQKKTQRAGTREILHATLEAVLPMEKGCENVLQKALCCCRGRGKETPVKHRCKGIWSFLLFIIIFCVLPG